jgi:hypothetical protein
MIQLKPIPVLVAVAAAALMVPRGADADELFVYYARLDCPDASEAALPGSYLTGKYADVLVQLAAGQLVFIREYSYLAYWEAGGSQWLVQEIVPRSGDGPSGRPDNINRCSYVRIIENSTNSVVIQYRYAPNLTSNHFTNLLGSCGGSLAKYDQDNVDEYCAIGPDGTVARTVRSGQAKLDVYDSPSNVTLETFALTAGGIANGPSAISTQLSAAPTISN